MQSKILKLLNKNMKYSGYKRHESVKEDCFPFMPFRGPGPYLFRQSLFELSPKSNIRITIKTFIKIIVQFMLNFNKFYLTI
jgi:hypothetical protein